MDWNIYIFLYIFIYLFIWTLYHVKYRNMSLSVSSRTFVYTSTSGTLISIVASTYLVMNPLIETCFCILHDIESIYIYIYIYIYIRLKIKPNSFRIRSLSWQFFVLPSTRFELTLLIHYSTNYLALCPAP